MSENNKRCLRSVRSRVGDLELLVELVSIVDLLSTRRSSSAAGSDAAASKSSFGTSHVCEKINPLDPFNGDPAQHH